MLLLMIAHCESQSATCSTFLMSSQFRDSRLEKKCSSPKCTKPVDDDHRYFDFHSISCNVCHIRRHWSCYGLSKSDYLLIREMSNYPFICPSCRKRCEIQYGVKKMFEEVIGDKLNINLREVGVKDLKIKIEFSVPIDSAEDSLEKVRRSRYDPVPNPIAVEREDEGEPIYEMPKFLRPKTNNASQSFYWNDDGEESNNTKCYYV